MPESPEIPGFRAFCFFVAISQEVLSIGRLVILISRLPYIFLDSRYQLEGWYALYKNYIDLYSAFFRN